MATSTDPAGHLTWIQLQQVQVEIARLREEWPNAAALIEPKAAGSRSLSSGSGSATDASGALSACRGALRKTAWRA